MNRSAASVSSSARRIATGGIDWPNETVAVLTWPRQLLAGRHRAVALEHRAQIGDLVALRRNRGRSRRSCCRAAR